MDPGEQTPPERSPETTAELGGPRRREPSLSGEALRDQLVHAQADPALSKDLAELVGGTIDELD